MVYELSPELYERYKDAVLKHSLAIQRYTGTVQETVSSSLTDRQIAAKLGISERDVREIRCIAETDVLTLDHYAEAEEFKNLRSRGLWRRHKKAEG